MQASSEQSRVGILALRHPSSGPCIVGGHRGNGMNLLDVNGLLRPLQRENTLRSFQEAASMGAAFVEFDVQVTSDGVAVLWHDDEVAFGEDAALPTSKPVSALSLKDMNSLVTRPSSHTDALSPAAHINPDTPPTAESTPTDTTQTSLLRRFYNVASGSHLPEPSYRRWLCADDDVIPTLAQVLRLLPPGIGVNIEVKLTNPLPGEPFLTPAAEIDRLLLPILSDVQQSASTCGGSSLPRPVMFSSFDPDVCAALRARQARHPVCFLSGCGLYPHQDERRTSVLAALRFAAQVGCAGVVVPAPVALSHAGLVSQAAELGLQVASYGLENSVAENVRRQISLGLLAVISDDVAVAVATASVA
ncbi:MAG: hypothetical protein WDW38_001369 [Sanguina aurantia]